MKRLFTVALAMSLLAACGGEEPQESADASNNTEPSLVEAQEETTEQSATTESVMHGEAPERDDEYFEESSDDAIEEGATPAEEETLAILRDAYEDRGHVYFGSFSKTIFIYPTDPGMELIVKRIEGGNTPETWDGIVEEMVGLSATLNDTLGEGYSIRYMTPMSGESAIIVAKDGALVYDFANDH